MADSLFQYTNPSISTTFASMPRKANSVTIDYANLTLLGLSIDDEPPKRNYSFIGGATPILNEASNSAITIPTGVPNFNDNNSMMNQAELNALQDQLSKMEQSLLTQDATFSSSQDQSTVQ